MKDNDKQIQVNEKYLDIIQATITRMGQNSFQAKTWGITIVSGLLVFMFNKEGSDNSMKILCIGVAIVVTCLFCFLDTYYLYLERGYRDLYNIAANLIEDKTVKDYDLSLPKESRGFKKAINAFFSYSTGLFYCVVVFGLILLSYI